MTRTASSSRPLRVLLSDPARRRLAARLASMAGDIEIVLVGSDDVDDPPDIAYLSSDLLQAGLLPVIATVMRGGDGMRRGKRARWVQSCSAGVDHPSFADLAAAGVRITKSNAQAPAIADYVLCQVLARLHPLAEARHAQMAAAWQRLPFREIADTRWLIVGFGATGTEIAVRLKGFGAHLTVVKRDPTANPLADRVLPPDAMLGAVPEADVVVLACPLTAATRGMADHAVFAVMKPGAVFVNVGRGALVDEPALLAGLDAGRPGMAILDVFSQEPLPATSPFWRHPAVRVTAHGAGAGSGVMARNDALFLENLSRYRRGMALLGDVAPMEVDPTPADAAARSPRTVPQRSPFHPEALHS